MRIKWNEDNIWSNEIENWDNINYNINDWMNEKEIENCKIMKINCKIKMENMKIKVEFDENNRKWLMKRYYKLN